MNKLCPSLFLCITFSTFPVFAEYQIKVFLPDGTLLSQYIPPQSTNPYDEIMARPDYLAAFQETCGPFPDGINTIADPTGTWFECANFSNTDMSNLNLTEVGMRFVKFKNANLNGTTMTYFDGGFADISNASLVGSNFNYGNFYNATFQNSNLTNMNGSGADFKGTVFSNANLTNSVFQSSLFEHANFNGANLAGADFTDSNLSSANLTNILYNANTKWPDGFSPPPSRDGYVYVP